MNRSNNKLIPSSNVYEPIFIFTISVIFCCLLLFLERYLGIELDFHPDARTYIEDFFWKYFCDNYLELIKNRVYNTEHSKERKSALLTLNYTFNTILKLFAPFIPHITEELNSIIYKENQELISQTGMWPKLKNFYFSNDTLSVGTQVLVILELVRKYK